MNNYSQSIIQYKFIYAFKNTKISVIN